MDSLHTLVAKVAGLVFSKVGAWLGVGKQEHTAGPQQ